MKVSQFKHEMTTNSSIFGRKGKVAVVFEGEQAMTDGDTITLPAMAEGVVLTPEEVGKMRGYVDHEAGHLRHSDMPLLMEKYKQWVDAGKTGLKHLANVCEDQWMETRVIQDYPGSWRNLSICQNWTMNRSLPILRENAETLQEFNVTSIHVAIALTCDKGYNLDARKELESLIKPELLDHAEVWNKHIQNCNNSADVIEVAKAIYKLIEDDPDLESSPEDFDPEDNEIDEGKPDEDGQEPAGGQETPGQQGKGDAQEGKEGLSADVGQALEDDKEEGIPGIGKPEGDHVGDYRVMSTKDDEYPTLKDPGKYSHAYTQSSNKYNKIASNLSGSVNVLKSKLRRALIAKERRDWDPGKEQGRLDSKRLVAAYQGSPSVYKTRKDREELNTSVLILLDMSGSMCGQPIKTSQECMIALAECLEGTSIKYQISGFTTASGGRTEDHSGSYHRACAQLIPTFKSFDDPLRVSKTALGGIDDQWHMKGNADRDAVVWATNELTKREEDRKVLVVLSDGHPASRSINVGWQEQGRHLRLAVEDAKLRGVECIGLGIMSDAVSEYYPDYVVVESLEDFTGQAFNKFTQTLLKGKRK